MFSSSDRAAHFPGSREAAYASYEQWLSEVNRRYPSYVAALNGILKKEAVPPAVLDNIRDRIARVDLGGLAIELYIPFYTPDELTQLRRDLDAQASALWRLTREIKQTEKTNGLGQ
jgi:hypothetical protein